MAEGLSAQDVLAVSSGFQRSCVLMAAADLDVCAHLADRPLTANELAERISGDLRATTTLLDALAAMAFLNKHEEGRYALAAGAAELLTTEGSRSVLGMLRHHGTCMRRWVQLAEVVLSGSPAQPRPSIRGEDADKAAFIEAMFAV